MFYKLAKKSFGLLINFLKALQVGLIFLCFLVLIYWVFQVMGAEFIKPVAPFFDGIQNFIHIFYTRKVETGGYSVDFSFLLATFLFLVISWSIKFVIEFVEVTEKNFDLAHKVLKKKSEESFNIHLEREYVTEEQKNNKFIILINFYAVDLTKDSFFVANEPENVEQKQIEKRREILDDFYETLEGNLDCQDKLTGSGLFMYFNDFENIDKSLFYIESIVKNMKNKYKTQNWQINYLISLDVYSNEKEALVKAERLKVLNKLEFRDKIVCMGTFKQRYSLLKNPKYGFEVQGMYAIKGNEEVFCLKTL